MPDVVITHPRTFAIIFACMIVFLSILRRATMIYGVIDLEALPFILLISALIDIIEG